MEEIWNNCLTLLGQEIDSPSQLSLVRSLRIVVADNNRLRVFAPSQWAYKQIDKALTDTIRSCLNRVGGKNVLVSLEIDREAASKNTQTPAAVRETTFKPEFSFKNFVEGSSNSYAYEVCQAICKPSTHFQQLLIFGGVGLGKTHLLHAVGNEILRTAPNSSVLYFHSEFFISRAVTAMRDKKTDEFVEWVRSCDCLLLDDLQFIFGKKATENVLLNILDSFIMENKRFAVVCDRHPKSLPDIPARLQSRLCSALTTSIEPPDRQTRIEILKDKAVKLKLPLDEDSLHHIADNIHSNVRELEGALKRISSLVHFCGRKPNIVTVREALKDIVSSVTQNLTIDHIVHCVADYHQVTVEQIVSPSRMKKIAQARHICVYFCKELTRDSMADIGDYLGKRDHTTIRHSYNKICGEIDKNATLNDSIKELRHQIIN